MITSRNLSGTVGILFLLPTTSLTIHAQRVCSIGEGVTSLGVFDLLTHDGKLHIAGMFPSFNGHERKNLQAWDGQVHYDMEGAFMANGQVVRALDVFEGQLVATGNDVALGHIARWDGSTWSTMGVGLPARGNALVVYNGELIAGCENGHVLKWDGSFWTLLGAGFNGPVRALAIVAGELVAGGDFDEIAGTGVEAKGLASWSGMEWGQLHTGLDGRVNTLLPTDDGLVIGGSFATDGTGTLTLTNWTVYDGAFSEETEVPGLGEILGTAMHPEGGLLLLGSLVGRVMVDGVRTIYFSLGRAIESFDGRLFVAGGVGGSPSYSDVHGIGEMRSGQDVESLDANGIGASIFPGPRAFDQFLPLGSTSTRVPGFEAPKGSGIRSIGRTSPWVIGYAEGLLHSATAFGGAITNSGSVVRPWAGPQAEEMDVSYRQRYHQVWKVSRSVIDAHIVGWSAPGYQIPEGIVSWPGNGVVANGEPMRLAPFADLDGDDLYEPEHGEYPLIRGDQAIYSIQHTEPESFEGSLHMELDLHAMYYVYGSEEDPHLWNTVFSNYRYINRGETTYQNVRFGQYVNSAVGCHNDDFMGCDSLLNLFFYYNWQEVDQTCQGSTGYGAQPPAQGVVFLNQSMTSHGGYYEGPAWFGVNSMLDAMNGTRLGNPYYAGYPTNFQFPGGEYVEIIQAPVGRRSVGATGPFQLAPGDTLCIDMAFMYARALSGGAWASVDSLKVRAMAISEFYVEQGFECERIILGVSEGDFDPGRTLLYPNPSDGSFTIVLGGVEDRVNVIIFSMSGAVVLRSETVDGSRPFNIDATALEPGMYVVDLQGQHQRRVARFTKQ